jgi:hypothetical protein
VVFDKVFVAPLLFAVLMLSTNFDILTPVLVIAFPSYLEEFDVLRLLAGAPAAEIL